MTKKFWLIALIVACTVVFGSCDKSEELRACLNFPV